MKPWLVRSLILTLSLVAFAPLMPRASRPADNGNIKKEGDSSLYDIEVKNISGHSVKLNQYRGKVLLIVNAASKCGFTSQYDGLQKLYEEYKDQGLVVLGFPSNDFMQQEPGTNEQILQFCRTNYGVTFPMFSKIPVKGKGQHPLYKYLTSRETNPYFSGGITWNFNKFLISRRGVIADRFDSRVKPLAPELIAAIETALNSDTSMKGSTE